MDYLQYKSKFIELFYGLKVLNLVINGLPSIQKREFTKKEKDERVLNLVINGLPSILLLCLVCVHLTPAPFRFKPCYKWITFNTNLCRLFRVSFYHKVLNLVINGLPSIQEIM